MALRKQLPCGKEMSYKLVAGPAGFARAQVGTEFEETEVANLLLTVKKRPAGAKKKPAAADASDDKSELSDPPVEEEGDDLEEKEQEDDKEEEEEQQEDEDGKQKEPAEAPRPKTYSKMWYKNSLAFGLRQKFGAKTQVCCLGGKKCSMTKDQLAAIADEAIVPMQNGSMSEEQARKAAKAKLV